MEPTPGPNAPCPCTSGAKYKRCCKPWHDGRPAPTPEALMRSRFAAYRLGLVAYVLETTDPTGPQARADGRAWARDVDAFCRRTDFQGLEVLEASAEGDAGVVRFRARLAQGGRDASFEERSAFRRVDGRWLYHDATPPVRPRA